jgi:hypothetical protein
VFELLGDYNQVGQTDYGFVSAADYTIWADNLSTQDLVADGDDDGDVDGDDYDVWTEHFGNTLDLEDLVVV